VAKMLKRSAADITCECRRMGGGFGGKESQAAQWAALAALAAPVDRPSESTPARRRVYPFQDTRGFRHPHATIATALALAGAAASAAS